MKGTAFRMYWANIYKSCNFKKALHLQNLQNVAPIASILANNKVIFEGFTGSYLVAYPCDLWLR
jgi:hypothetical protein